MELKTNIENSSIHNHLDEFEYSLCRIHDHLDELFENEDIREEVSDIVNEIRGILHKNKIGQLMYGFQKDKGFTCTLEYK